MHNFRFSHPESPAYCSILSYPDWKSFSNISGWTDHWLGDHLVYSHRKTHYSVTTFPDKLHSHEYYELLIPRRGDVAFISNNHCITPQPGSLILFKPGDIHTARLLSESDYERYAFLFDDEAFHLLGSNSALLDFLQRASNHILFPSELEDTLFNLLRKIDHTLSEQAPDSALLAYSYIIQLFHLINHHAVVSNETTQILPQNILKIKQYVDENYLTLNTTTDVAEHFFYHREYVSRLFKKYFNTNLSDYLTSLKIRHSKKLLENGASVTDACYNSGFRNMSTFTSAFRSYVRVNPSTYRKKFGEGR